MKLIDANIIIYSIHHHYSYLRPIVMDKNNFVSVITKVETLGYHKLSAAEKAYHESVFNFLQIIPVDDKIIEKAIEIRQQQNIKLGDCLIAATALVHNLEVYSRNVPDFQKIPGLTVVNPI
ncbi:MAG: type II toxin-antitoxin system VapC family toxin [Saprospiraceae bacterium]